MSSMLGKYKIAVDTAVLANGDSIAAYLTSASGALISSTAIGGNEHLRVVSPSDEASGSTFTQGTTYGALGLAVRHDANTTLALADGQSAPLQLDANGYLKVNAILDSTGDYAEDSPAASGDIGLFTLLVRQDTLAASTSADGDYGAFKSNNLGELYVHDTSVLAQLVTANTTLGTIATNTGNTNSSILALSKAEDAAHASGDLGIQALAVRKDGFGSNAGADGDYTSLQTWSEGSLKVVDTANGSILQQQVTVAATATALPTAPLASRRGLMVQNAGNASIWVGSGTVTASGATTGIEVPKGGFIELEVGPSVAVSAIAASGSVNVNVLELA